MGSISTESSKLTELLSTRFCHDLAGAISAVNNGVELLLGDDVDDQMQKQVMDLLSLSSHEALAKLQMYRMAYGRAEQGISADVSEVIDIASTFFAKGKVVLDWSKEDLGGFETKIDISLRRIVTLMIVILSSLTIFGGRISVSRSNNTIKVVASNERLKDLEELNEIVSGKDTVEMTVDNVVIFYLVTVVKERGFNLSYGQGGDSKYLELSV